MSGSSMSEIAQRLNKEHIEYKEDVAGWNKARIKRLLEDERYIGNKSFPPLVDKDMFIDIRKTIAGRSNCPKSERRKALFQINIPIRCPKCRGKMERKRDRRYKKATKWHCENKDCRFMVAKEDEEILENIGKILKHLAEEPEVIGIGVTEMEPEPPSLSYDFSRQGNFDKDTLRGNILNVAAKTYSELDDTVWKSKRLYDLFQEAKVIDGFPKELFEKAVAEVGFDSDGTLWVRLINGMKIGEEEGECLRMNQPVL